MPLRVQMLRSSSRESLRKLKFIFSTKPTTHRHHNLCSVTHPTASLPPVASDSSEFSVSHQNGEDEDCRGTARIIQNFLKNKRGSSSEVIERALDHCNLSLTEDLLVNVLQRHGSDWKPAYIFFRWACKGEFSPGSDAYNGMADILGRMRRFEELNQLLDEMSQRNGLFNESTFGIVVNRYAASHRVEEATELFHKRKAFGLQHDLVGFQTLLISLCRHKHVEVAEALFQKKKTEFPYDIKTMNIILNGWCVLGNVREAKRFWTDIILSKCMPDRFTYGIFINSLCKKGKLGSALKLFKAMWKKGFNPDVPICNCIIDALCFKKRIPEALEVFREMNERNCPPNAATYNSLIKHLCKIWRIKKAFELLDEMEGKRGSCLPNARTYGYLLKSTKRPEEVEELLGRMERNQCTMTSDTCNLILNLYARWGCWERVESTWVEMERSGLGPDRRSYTVIIHGFYEKGRTKDALRFFNEMISKGIEPEPRTYFLVNAMNTQLKEGKCVS